MTKQFNCNCQHEFQDQQYGKGKRVHNLSADGKKATCTVCKNEKKDIGNK